LIEGEVVRFEGPRAGSDLLKVPQVGWNRIVKTVHGSWDASPLEGLRDGEFMYFVHSYYAKPADERVVLAATRYGQIEFCSSLRFGNIFACQFHPERSGPQGLQIYRNLARQIQGSVRQEVPHG
jgi:glutamine amidotransferase